MKKKIIQETEMNLKEELKKVEDLVWNSFDAFGAACRKQSEATIANDDAKSAYIKALSAYQGAKYLHDLLKKAAELEEQADRLKKEYKSKLKEFGNV